MDWTQTLANIAGGAIGGAIVGFFAFRIGYRRGAAAMRQLAEAQMRGFLDGIIDQNKIKKVDSPILAPGSVRNAVIAPGAIRQYRVPDGSINPD